jgi:hypothetical protein
VAGSRYVASAAAIMPWFRHCLSAAVFVESFPSSGYFCWLYNFGFQQTYRNIINGLGMRRYVTKESTNKLKSGVNFMKAAELLFLKSLNSKSLHEIDRFHMHAYSKDAFLSVSTSRV